METITEMPDVDADWPTDDREVASTDVPEGSPLARLRAKRDEIAEHSETLDLDVPGYDGELVVRLGWRPYERLRAVGKRVAKLDKRLRDKYTAADALALAVDEVCMRVSGELRHLSDGFDAVLAEALGIDLDGVPPSDVGRVVVFETYANEHAMLGHGQRYGIWLRASGGEVDAGLLGE